MEIRDRDYTDDLKASLQKGEIVHGPKD
jgi:hypothetical protein